jgi:hypothetical protein
VYTIAFLLEAIQRMQLAERLARFCTSEARDDVVAEFVRRKLHSLRKVR